MKVPVEQINKSVARYNSWQSGREAVDQLPEEVIKANADKTIPSHVTSGNILTAAENRVKRKEMIAATGQEPVEFAYERAIGNNDSVYSNFCDLIIAARQKVGRVVVKEGSRDAAYATGFMVSERLLLTNWHVFKTEGEVGQSVIEFFYDLDISGNPGTTAIFKLNSKEFFYSFQELDYCFVAVEPVDISGTIQLSSIGYIFLDPTLGKLGDEGKELMNIIHHPDGDYKQLSIRENLFTKIMPTSIWYKSDTAPGSSGSPVFNDQWQVVALHHLGVPAMTPDGKFYLDKNGNKIGPVNGEVDVSKIYWIANEGIRISVILKDIATKFPGSGFITALGQPPGPAIIPPSGPILIPRTIPKPELQHEKQDNMNNNSAAGSGDVRIAFPASLLGSGKVTVNIQSGGAQAQPVPQTSRVPLGLVGPVGTTDTEEAKKLARADGVDYSDCTGYDPAFLGIDIPMPQPKKTLGKFIAKLKDSDETILDYHHYSVIFHSVRMMPLISAINVDGDPKKRKDKEKRVDDWLPDNRLDYDIQLDDAFYARSHFDKGHMSRREDADWGTTAEEAKLFADMTCRYTNACPQVPTLNQSKRGGLWGKLETVVLEKGATKEKGITGKITVLNGPVFKDSDSVFKGIQVPLDFFKVILWFNDNKELKATAFRLSQAGLEGDIKFDEALMLNANIPFQEYQCSIQSLENDTKIDFSHIEKFDTFRSEHNEESKEIHSVKEVEDLVIYHNPGK